MEVQCLGLVMFGINRRIEKKELGPDCGCAWVEEAKNAEKILGYDPPRQRFKTSCYECKIKDSNPLSLELIKRGACTV